MTENSAKELKIAAIGNGNSAKGTLKMYLDVLNELEAYKELGEIEDIKLIFSLCKDLEERVKQFEAIGTIEEFRILKERNTPKKPIKKTFCDWTYDYDEYYCPTCNEILRGGTYCKCGQKIDY